MARRKKRGIDGKAIVDAIAAVTVAIAPLLMAFIGGYFFVVSSAVAGISLFVVAGILLCMVLFKALDDPYSEGRKKP